MSLTVEERRNGSALYNPLTLDVLSNKYPSIPWKEYLNTLLSGITEIQQNEIINVFEPKFIAGLEKLLKTTSPRVLANYATWRVIRESIDFTLNDDLRNRQLKFKSVLSGISVRPSRLVL